MTPATRRSPSPAPGARATRRVAGSSRRCSTSRPHVLEAGGRLEHVTVAYETWGTLAPDASNAVLVLHALTGDSHAAGPAGPGHRERRVVGRDHRPGRADRHRPVLRRVPQRARRLPGHDRAGVARTGRPAGRTARGSRVITIRDQVVVEAALADALGIERWAAVVGGSMGGKRALEWAVSLPRARAARAIVVAVGAEATAEEIALCSLQIRAIRGRSRASAAATTTTRAGDEGPWRGMSLARGIGQVSYRSELEFDERFGRGRQGDEQPLEGGRYAVESYLEYHGEKLARRFDANTYIVLSRRDEPPRRRPRAGRDRGRAAPDHRRGHDRRDLLGPALPAPAPARARGAHPGATGVEVIESIVRPRRLPHRDRGRRQGHHRRAGLTTRSLEVVSRRRRGGPRGRGRG